MNSILFRFWRRSLVWAWRIAPAGILVAGLAVPLYDRLSPWPPAMDALSAYPGQARLCVGLAGEFERTPSSYHESMQRSFVLLPRAFTAPSVITITSEDNAAPVVEESRVAFWFTAAIDLIALVIFGYQIRGFFTRHWQRRGPNAASSTSESQ